jgi:hypothetical protein
LPGEHGARRYSVLKIKAHGAQHGAGHGTRHGTGHGAPVCTPDGARVDAEYLIYRLEEAGRTLLALPHSGPSTRLRTARHDIVQSALEAYGWHSVEPRLRPPVPSPAQITRMDEALDWIPRIPQDRYVLRRILGARALISPITGRHLFSWRRLATLLGADHKAIQRWHAQGIDLLVHLLAAP